MAYYSKTSDTSLGFLHALLTDRETDHPRKARERLLRLFQDVVDYRYASVWTHHPDTDTLHLAACSGDSDLLSSSVLKKETPAGDILLADENSDYVYIDDVKNDPRYRDQQLIEKYDLKQMYSFRLGERKKPIGTVCIYPKSPLSDLKSREAAHSLELASLFLDLARDRFQIRIEDELSNALGRKDDIGSFLHKIIDILSKYMSIQGMTFFLWDEANQSYYAAQSTGLDTSEKLSDIRYTADEPYFNKLIGGDEYFLHGKEAETVFENTRFRELDCSTFHTVALVPFTDARDKGKNLGFARFVNEKNYVKPGDNNYFSRNDINIFSRVAESIALGIHFFNEEEYVNSVFSHFLHESGEAIEGIEAKCARLLKPERFGSDERPARLHIEDIDAYADGLKALVQQYSSIGVDVNNVQLNLRKCKPLHDLIVPCIQSAMNLVRKEHNLSARTEGKRRIRYVLDLVRETGFTYDLNVDRTRVRHVLANLLKNAVKYRGDKEDEFEVEIRFIEKGGYIKIFVSDTGMGIKNADRVRIFDKGFRGADARRRYVFGTGIGLHLCRSYMEKHGGSIKLLDRSDYKTFNIDSRFKTSFVLHFTSNNMIWRSK